MNKKIYITEAQFNHLVEGKKENKKKKKAIIDYVKANRRARREEEREMYGDGFKPTTRIAASKNTYNRKKDKFRYDKYNGDD